jgi:hypothetical protein
VRVSVATPRTAIAAVMTAVDALDNRSANEPARVSLQMQVGSEQLGLHVEVRDGTVHTTFRTDSPELRSALTQEWQAVVPATGHEMQVAPPVFLSVPSAGADAGFTPFGQGPSQQRGQPAPEPATFSLSRGSADAATAEPVAAPVAALSSVSLLNAFA